MGKDPAFLFYSQDFLVGTLTMNHEDRGKYIFLLCYMHQKGRLSEETICLLVGSLGFELKSKFKMDSHGMYYNERLEEEVEKRRQYIDSRSINGKKGGRPKTISKASENHMDKSSLSIRKANEKLIENENENENKDDLGIGGMGEREKVDSSNYQKHLEQIKSNPTFVEYLQKVGQVDLSGLNALYEKFFDKHIAEQKVWDNHSELRKHLGNYIAKVGPISKKEDEYKPAKTPRRAN